MRHPGSKKGRQPPAAAQVRAAREAAGLTQTQAAAVVYGSLRAWQQWEASDRKMHPGLWELFCRKTDLWNPDRRAGRW